MDKFETHVDEHGIVNMAIKGRVRREVWDQFKKWIEDTQKIIKEEYDKTGKKVRATVDLTDTSSQYDSDTIAALASFTKANEPYMEKTATFGANTMIKFAEDLVITISGRKNIKAFATKDEATKWLLSEK
ncbi:MAG: STAS/SEC14 domain-containing protein [Patescibacteria group bacterium]|nr:STAS/SEC14 domain-containing protein [bacterium]MDZ4240859.1 STAS/SEC14 domain-containing protein [Patescibacteria group bacterium]